MKNICLCFQIHQPYRLRRYRFFDIGNEHYYNDDFQNQEIFNRIAEECYLPAGRMLLELLQQYPDFRVSFSISGLVIEQMEYYSPLIIKLFRDLVATGRVEFVSETYAHSITSLYDPVEFRSQLQMHAAKLRELFGIERPKVLCNTELFYSDEIAEQAIAMGYEGVITEGAKHVLGWKSPNYIYGSKVAPKLKLLLRNAGFSQLITNDFSNYASPEYPVTADKLLNRLRWLPEDEKFVMLYMNYEVLGSINKASSGIFDFFRALPAMAGEYGVGFATPSELIKENKPVGSLSVLDPISSFGEERGVNAWVGNVLQQGVIEKLRLWGERVRTVKERQLLQDWLYLQSSDHLFYMNTVDPNSHIFSPYSSPYDAFNNYMNVLSDFLLRVEKLAPSSISIEELDSYQQTIHNQNLRIEELEQELASLRKV